MRRLALVCLLLLPAPAWANRLWTAGFEEGSIFSPNIGWVAPGTSVTVVTTGSPHGGTHHLNAPSGSTNTTGPRRDLPGAGRTTGTFYYREYFLPATVRATSVLELFQAVAPTETVTGTYALTAGVQYRVEVKHVSSDTVGSVEVKLFIGDSTTAVDDFTTATSTDTLPTTIGQWYVGPPASTANGQNFYYDDVCLNDDLTSASDGQTSWCGPGTAMSVLPTGNVSVTWTIGGTTPAATNWQGVIEMPPDDAVTINKDSGTTNTDEFTITSLSSLGVPSNAVMVVFTVLLRGQAVASSQTVTTKIWDDGGTPTASAAITLGNAAYGTPAVTPQTKNLAGKTRDQVSSYHIGYSAAGGASEKDITTIWGTVEYAPAAAAGGGGNLGILLGGAGQ
jgi:hypothetical protein